MGTSRTRSRVISSTAVNCSGTGTIYYPGTCTSLPLNTDYSWSTDKLGREETEVMTDVVTPEFKRLSAKGGIINNPMTKTHTKTICEGVSWERRAYAKDYTCTPKRWIYYLKQDESGVRHPLDCGVSSSISGLLLDPPAMDTTALMERATTRAWSKIDTSETLALVQIAEGEKTVKSMISLFKKLRTILFHLKWKQTYFLKKDFSIKEMEEFYMEARYSVRPLCYDAVGTLNALTRKLNGFRQTYRGSFTEEASNSVSNTYVASPQPWIPASFIWRREVNREISARAGVLVDVDDVNALQVWGMDRILESAWELVRFSFVIDWFLNISDVLGALSPNCGMRSLASWVTLKDVVTQDSFVAGCTYSVNPPSAHTYEGFVGVQGGGVTKITTTKTRVPNPSRYNLPHFAVRLDCFKLIDLALIVKSLWRGGRYPLARGLRL